jgi:hypothetical protein
VRTKTTVRNEIQETLRRLSRVYANCRTYEDWGTVREIVPNASGQRQTLEDFFSTAFDRARKRFKFEFRGGVPARGRDASCLVWRKGSTVRFWHALDGRIEPRKNLSLGLASAAGLTLGASFQVPRLLQPGEIDCRGLLELDDLRMEPDDEFNGCACRRFSGRFPSGSRLTVWIERETWLILRIEHRATGSPAGSGGAGPGPTGADTRGPETVITYCPRINLKIPLFRFEWGK